MDAETQVRAEKSIRAEAEAIFARQNVGNLFGALACGTDIVVAEAALDAGIPFHAVLPFPVARFAELSLDIGDTKDAKGIWRRRFDDVLSRAASLAIVDDELPLDRDLDGHFYYGFRFMAGLALLRANVLQAECRLIAVTDSSEPKNMAGAARSVADWLAAGRPLDTIEFPFVRKTPAGRARRVLIPAGGFLVGRRGQPRRSGRHEESSESENARRCRQGFLVVPRASRVGGEGTAIIAPTLDAALRLAEACAEANSAIRVICDFGPALGPDLTPDEKTIARLKAGSDMPGFPAGRPLATLPFTAQAVAAFGAGLNVHAVGRTEETRGAGEGRARRRSGLPVYRIRFAKSLK